MQTRKIDEKHNVCVCVRDKEKLKTQKLLFHTLTQIAGRASADPRTSEKACRVLLRMLRPLSCSGKELCEKKKKKERRKEIANTIAHARTIRTGDLPHSGLRTALTWEGEKKIE